MERNVMAAVATASRENDAAAYAGRSVLTLLNMIAVICFSVVGAAAGSVALFGGLCCVWFAALAILVGVDLGVDWLFGAER
jgi:K+ transporter